MKIVMYNYRLQKVIFFLSNMQFSCISLYYEEKGKDSKSEIQVAVKCALLLFQSENFQPLCC